MSHIVSALEAEITKVTQCLGKARHQCKVANERSDMVRLAALEEFKRLSTEAERSQVELMSHITSSSLGSPSIRGGRAQKGGYQRRVKPLTGARAGELFRLQSTGDAGKGGRASPPPGVVKGDVMGFPKVYGWGEYIQSIGGGDLLMGDAASAGEDANNGRDAVKYARPEGGVGGVRKADGMRPTWQALVARDRGGAEGAGSGERGALGW